MRDSLVVRVLTQINKFKRGVATSLQRPQLKTWVEKSFGYVETRFLLRKYYCFYEKVRDKEKKPTVRRNFEGVFHKKENLIKIIYLTFLRERKRIKKIKSAKKLYKLWIVYLYMHLMVLPDILLSKLMHEV